MSSAFDVKVDTRKVNWEILKNTLDGPKNIIYHDDGIVPVCQLCWPTIDKSSSKSIGA